MMHSRISLTVFSTLFFQNSAVYAFSATQNTWKVFVDLQCPYARKAWIRLPKIQKEFPEYQFSTHLTSLAFHPQAFVGQQAAYLIGVTKGDDAKMAFVNTAFRNQDLYTNAALGDCRKSDVDKVFSKVAEEAGVFDDAFTKDDFLSRLHDWENVIKPAYAEHKVALSYGVFGTPNHVINEQLMLDTESAWGPEEWRDYLNKLPQQQKT